LLLSIQIITEQAIWLSAFCILLGCVYAFVLYNKEDRFSDLNPWLKRSLAALRMLLVSILAFFLLSPFIKTVFNKVEKPVIIIAQDNSGSILLNKDSTFYKTTYLQQLDQLESNLSKDFEVKRYAFGEKIEEGNDVDYTSKVSNFSNLFDEVENKFYGRNVGALILASDGIINEGNNPLYGYKTEFPLYTIALGDTSKQKDVMLKEVNHNKITFLGNQFPLEIYTKSQACSGEKTQLTVSHNGSQLFTKQLQINGADQAFNETVLLKAKNVGVQHYRITLSVIDGEISTRNNIRDIYIEVLDGRQNVLVLVNSPHPDVKAIKQSVETNENYKVTTALFNEFDGDVEPYSLVIVHQIPEKLPSYFSRITESDISLWYILGNQTSVQQFNKMKLGLEITNSRNKYNEVLPVVAPNFPLFTLSEVATRVMDVAPPLSAPFGTYKMKTSGYALLNQKIGSVATENPLFVFYQNATKKVGVLVGEGIWKWRMHEFLKEKTQQGTNEIINKTVQFLAVKEDKSKFRILTKNNFLENEEVLLNAELYNDSYELVNKPEVSISISDKENNNYDFVFSRNSTAYFLNSGMLPVGFYNYKAKVTLGNKEYLEQGQFQINELLLEANNTVANHQLLYNLSEKFGGKLFYPSSINSVVEEIKENTNITSIIYEEKDLKELINLKWIFFILLFLLSLEWFLRKRNGAY